MTSQSSVDLENTRDAFNAAAGPYDAMYEDLPGIRRFREVTRRLYMRYFPRSASLLEVNCGTGSDAVYLARRGFRVLGTDISPAMIDQARTKISAEHLEGLAETMVLPFHQIASLRGRMFDGAYSNMGGLNCSDDLHAVARDLAPLVRPGGFFIATVMPPFCLWETAAALGRGRIRQAFRRQSRNGTIAHVHGGSVRTFYYSPGRFRRLLAPHFEHVQTVPLGVLLPPPNHVRAYRLLGSSLQILERLDTIVSQFVLSSYASDHFVMVARRTDP